LKKGEKSPVSTCNY